jgi:hypothetical protein
MHLEGIIFLLDFTNKITILKANNGQNFDNLIWSNPIYEE